jgi:hypothetical protein
MASNPRALVARFVAAFAGESAIVPYAPRAMKRPEPMTAVDFLHDEAHLPFEFVCDVMGKQRDLASNSGTISLSDPTVNGKTFSAGHNTITLNRLPMAMYRLIPEEAVVRVTIEVLSQ